MPQNSPNHPQFPVVRRGFDPDAVERHLLELRAFIDERVTAAESRYTDLELELNEARKREEAVHLTLIAATKTKEELLVNAQRDADETRARSKAQADELLGEAKKEAFRLTADARSSSEESTKLARAEAEQIASKAQEAAEATRDAARREAIEMIDSVERDTTSLVASQEAALADMRKHYEEEEAVLAARIAMLRATAADLESRLKAIASGSFNQAGDLVGYNPSPPQASVAEPATVAAAPAEARSAVQHDLNEAPLAAPQPEPMTASAPMSAEAAVPEVAQVAMPEVAEMPEVAQVAVPEVAEPTEAVAEEAAPLVDESEVAAAVAEAVGQSIVPAASVTEAEFVEEFPEAAEAPMAVEEPVVAEGPVTEAAEPVVPEVEPEVPVVREPVPAGVGARSEAVVEEGGSRKGSYYSRRSAKLPRIGNEAGRNALAAAQAIRGATRGNSPRDPDARSA